MSTDVRILLVVGMLSAGMASVYTEDEKIFSLWSTTSSLCMGAAIGILQENNGTKTTFVPPDTVITEPIDEDYDKY